MPYQCGVCKKTFDAMTADGLCPNPACYGEPLKYVVSAAPGQPAVAGETAASQGKIEDIGLCVLVCDASYSMNDAAFADNPAVKLRLVANAVRRAIVELTQIGRPETAYIAIVAFGGRAELIRDRAGKPFLKSVAEIKRDLDNDIGDYLFDTFDRDGANVNRGYTDISAVFSSRASCTTLRSRATSRAGACPRPSPYASMTSSFRPKRSKRGCRIFAFSSIPTAATTRASRSRSTTRSRRCNLRC